MSKHSLQMECLESIEAYSDEQLNAEMAVIESVLEIFDKSILMMELSNSDIDLPDCSMFMESTTIQESDGDSAKVSATDDAATATSGGGGATDTTTGDNTSTTNNTSEKKTMTEDERKAYNKEHWVRMKNKNGKTENIFISIIAFIPRLLGFLIQCVVKLFKKITNKKSDDKIKKASQDAQGLTEEEIEETSNETDAELPEDTVDQDQSQPQAQGQQQQPQPAPVQNNTQNAEANPAPAPTTNMNDNVGKMDPKSKMWGWYDEQKVLEAIINLSNVMSSLYLTNFDTVIAFGNEIIKGKNQLNAALSQRVGVNGDVLVSSKDNILRQLNGLAEAAKRTSRSIKNFINDRDDISRALRKGKIVRETKKAVDSLKGCVSDFSKESSDIIKNYNKSVKQSDKIIAKKSRKNGGAATQPQGGGDTNGGQQQQPQQQPQQTA